MPIANFVRKKINVQDVCQNIISLIRHQDCVLCAVKHKKGANCVNHRVIAQNVWTINTIFMLTLASLAQLSVNSVKSATVMECAPNADLNTLSLKTTYA